MARGAPDLQSGSVTLPSTFPSGIWWESWESNPVGSSTERDVVQTCPVTLPSTVPRGGRRDSHPLQQGSQPCTDTLRTRPPYASTWRESNSHPSLIGRLPSPLGYRWLSRIVWVIGVAPTASRSRTERSTTELHPDAEKLPCQKASNYPAAVTPHGGPRNSRAKRVASESNTAVPDLEFGPFSQKERRMRLELAKCGRGN